MKTHVNRLSIPFYMSGPALAAGLKLLGQRPRMRGLHGNLHPRFVRPVPHKTVRHSIVKPTPALALAASLFALSALWVTGASATPTRAEINGLPAGLSTELLAYARACPTATSPGLMKEFANVPMVESTLTVLVSVRRPDGTSMTVPRLVTSYGVQTDINMNGPCGARENVEFGVRVLGERTTASLGRRDAGIGHQQLADRSYSIRGTLQGASHGLQKRDPIFVNVSFTQLARGVFHTIGATHENPFGNTSTVTPMLRFIKPAPLLQAPAQGVSVSTRLFITEDGRKCIGAGSTVKCFPGAALENGLLVHGGIALSISQTEFPQVSSTTSRGSHFTFKLNDDFPVGEYKIEALADDLDSIDYLVDGVPMPLNLIKWLPVSQTVQIVN